jgi:hypothetical protein
VNQNNLAGAVQESGGVGPYYEWGVPRLFDISIDGNNLSQGLRDQMNCFECDEDSQRINRACLAEGRKNTGRDRCADSEWFAIQHEEEVIMEGSALA